jgi:hypothetical protein
MSQQIVFTSTTQSQSVGPFSSTKVRVVAGPYPAFFNVGNVSVAAAPGNCEIIAANSIRYINMKGLNNYIAFYGNAGAATYTVQQIGTVSSGTLPTYDATGNIVMRTA